MRKNEVVTFNKSKWGSITFLLFLLGAITSVIPEESLNYLIINLALATIGSVLIFIFWKIHQNNSKRYFSLGSYVMMMTLALYTCIPIFRTLAGTNYIWLVVALLALLTLPTHLFKEKLLNFIKTPYKYGFFGKVFIFVLIMIFFYGTFIWIVSLAAYDQVNNLGLLGSTAIFAVGTILLFFAPIMLIKPEDVEKTEYKLVSLEERDV
ncbi:hypothetical protein ACLIA0_04660 [Bacillaceae bacterium W0354]